MITYEQFIAAAINNHVDVIKQYLAENIGNPEAVNKLHPQKQDTALVLAVVNNRTDAVKELLTFQGIDVNEGGFAKNSPLMCSVMFCSNSAIALLLLEHPDVKAHMVCQDDLTPLMMAARRGRTDVVTSLLPRLNAQQINAVDSTGKTALMHARFSRKYDEIGPLLLQAGADANMTDRQGKTVEQFSALPPTHEVISFGVDNHAQLAQLTALARQFGLLKQLGPSTIEIIPTDEISDQSKTNKFV